MKIDINIDEEDVKRIIEKKLVKSDTVEDMVSDILERDEIQQLLVKRVKEVLLSDEIKEVIIQKVKDYIENDFDISYEDAVTDKIADAIVGYVHSKFE